MAKFNSLQFNNEQEFRNWFEQNYKQLGYKEIILSQRRATPDYVVRTNDNKILKLEVEFLVENFILHKHTKDKVDHILAFTTKKQQLKLDIPITLIKPYVCKKCEFKHRHPANWEIIHLIVNRQLKPKEVAKLGYKYITAWKYHKKWIEAKARADEKMGIK